MKLKTNQRHAFTLIELILALGVAAIVLVLVNTVLFSTLHLRQVTEDTVDAGSPTEQALSVMRRDLECVVTTTNGTSKVISGGFRMGSLSTPGVNGNIGIDMYTATGSLSGSAPWADIQRVDYELRSPADNRVQGQDLYRTVTRNLLSSSTVDIHDQYLMSGVASLKFSAYDGASWQTAWDTTSPTAVYTNLPTAVKVEIQLAANDPSEDPITLVVPIDSIQRTNMVLSTDSTTTTAQ